MANTKSAYQFPVNGATQHHYYTNNDRRHDKYSGVSSMVPQQRKPTSRQVVGTHREANGRVYREGFDSDEGIGEADIDSDDPTNTAMFLDESEENELVNVVPGTPLAFKKLGQMTVKSITRQRDSQTPGRPLIGFSTGRKQVHDNSSTSRIPRNDNIESPTKKSKKGHASLLDTAIPMLTPAAAGREGSRQRQGSEETAPLSVLRLRSSRRAGDILNTIKRTSPKPKAVEQKRAADGSALLMDFGTVAQQQMSSTGSVFGRDQPSAPVMSKLTYIKGPAHQPSQSTARKGDERQIRKGKAVDVCKTPESKRRRPRNDTPYNMLRALSEKSNESNASKYTELEVVEGAAINGLQGPAPSNENMHTPEKQSLTNADAPTPMTDCRKRIQSLRNYFNSSTNNAMADGALDEKKMTPVPPKHSSNLLISFDTVDRRKSDSSVPFSSQLSQISSIRNADEDIDLLQLSPSPIRPVQIAEDDAGGLDYDLGEDSASSLLLSYTSRQHDPRDLNKPIPFVLNQEDIGQQERQQAGGRANLIDLSFRLNSSINALNHGLREQLARNDSSRDDRGHMDKAADEISKTGAELNQSIASLTGHRETAVDVSPGAASAAQSELEGQVETLRKTMEDTKAIVFAIQSELDQQRQSSVSEDTKLDDIARLLGALDMRLHMIEDRQRFEQGVGSSAGGTRSSQRANAGSTKVHTNDTHGNDMVSRIGQLVVDWLSRYPLMLIGGLFVILVSELMVIGGIKPDVHRVRGLGLYALNEVKRHISVPEPPS
ncbi:hypothetical protein COEREDRAFT_82771 [Coemansia reversa NRRL 1564]|uniref:Uncharacterized protein n=1 Tax=Coemansia reversa (strain ATCC 12441 / NRRL 1564) TaxID=763665 RepID=A0A2G5B677_COERN|nr:hypothetical protein COEREDRAFT_82771 [Coemansia reversa NRRL 1564]|eukprot:PIA14510.1 hypothetical protein COEREDRAFT_82771 [Coemansia reversa NRRL 1564]